MVIFHLAKYKFGISVAELLYLLRVLRHCLMHLMDYLFKGRGFAIEPFVPLVIHQMMIEIFSLFMSCEYLVKNDEIVIVNKHLAKVKD